ncbi:MAG TPA: elongation factor G [Candidatus Krumholzibacteria bacterium]
MKSYAPADIRNVAIVAHQAAGKTTLAEAILFRTGAIGRQGSVDEGTSNLDYHANEIERKTSIYTALGACEHEKTKFNLVDTPGFEDFRGEVIAALGVVESALLVVRSDGGVEVGTAALWQTLEKYGLPALLVVSKMDKEHADFGSCMAQIRDQLSPKAVPVQIPIGQGDGFHGLIDVATGKAYDYKNPGEAVEMAIPSEMRAAYEEAREELLNAAAEHDDALVEKYLDEGDLSYDEIRLGIQIGVRDRSFFPVCACSPMSGIGMRAVLHFIKEYLPSAESTTGLRALAGKEETTLRIGAGALTCARVFKTALEKDAGDFSYIRVFAGKLGGGDELHNHNRNQPERLSQLFALEGKNREKIESIGCGDFGAAVKLKNTHTGDTLGDKNLDAVLPPFAFPEPNSRVALRPARDGEDDKLAQGMHRLNEEDPTFVFSMDPQTHEHVLQGQGELHFDVLLERLERRYKVEVTRHKPKIPYLETLKSTVDIAARHKKQSGGRGQFADVNLKFEPVSRGAGFEFVNAIVGGAIPGKFIPAVEKGLIETMGKGPLAGCRVVDIKVTLHDGGFHAVDSSEAAFKMAASLAMRDAFKTAKVAMLEPIYSIEVKCPEEVMGDVMGDLSSRRGRIMGSEQVGHFSIVKAVVPLSELYRYSTSLRSMTQGRGTHTRTFEGYEEVPSDLMQKIIDDAKKNSQEA